MYTEHLEMVTRLLMALATGGLIGFERSFHGRPAGFRTHTLVCLASAVLMLVALHQGEWFRGSVETVRVDPTRMAQGIMTGIGFLGAGVIIKEGLSVRGLTTAASIWITAALGIVAGVGLYFPLAVGAVLVLGTLSVFRWVEGKMPTQFYAHHQVRFSSAAPMPELALREVIREHGFSIANLSYTLNRQAGFLEYQMNLRARDASAARRLAETLQAMDSVLAFEVRPAGD
jgi:putative Mg2+ transporter-C (MgtC) family protein